MWGLREVDQKKDDIFQLPLRDNLLNAHLRYSTLIFTSPSHPGHLPLHIPRHRFQPPDRPLLFQLLIDGSCQTDSLYADRDRRTPSRRRWLRLRDVGGRLLGKMHGFEVEADRSGITPLRHLRDDVISVLVLGDVIVVTVDAAVMGRQRTRRIRVERSVPLPGGERGQEVFFLIITWSRRVVVRETCRMGSIDMMKYKVIRMGSAFKDSSKRIICIKMRVWTDLDLRRVSLAGGQGVVAKAVVPDRRTTSVVVHFLASSSCVSVCVGCVL